MSELKQLFLVRPQWPTPQWPTLYLWAQKKSAIIVTYDEDFADSRFYPLGHHHGIIRLRVWPTTIEQTQNAIERLITDLPPTRWHGCLIIIDNNKIRVRKVHNQ